jgi:hypothetical protein
VGGGIWEQGQFVPAAHGHRVYRRVAEGAIEVYLAQAVIHEAVVVAGEGWVY